MWRLARLMSGRLSELFLSFFFFFFFFFFLFLFRSSPRWEEEIETLTWPPPCRIHERFRNPGQEVKKGEELGIFQFGGSSIIVAFQEGKIEFDQDLLELSKRQIQVAVEVGMSLGRARG